MLENNEQKPIIGRCPTCDTRIRFQHGLKQYQVVKCPECGTELEVEREFPLKLSWAMEDDYSDRHSYY